jgi:hypothetical protein
VVVFDHVLRHCCTSLCLDDGGGRAGLRSDHPNIYQAEERPVLARDPRSRAKRAYMAAVECGQGHDPGRECIQVVLSTRFYRAVFRKPLRWSTAA